MKILVFNLGLSLLGMTTLLAQRVGFINDADGYTNLRAAASSQSEIISVIRQGEEFTYYPKNNANWYQVDFKGKSGFMHKSRIKSLGQLKAELNNFFKKSASATKDAVELGEIDNEKLFQFTQDYPKAVMQTFCQQPKRIQDFLLQEFESPIHDLIDLQLIYSRLEAIGPSCSDASKLKSALKKAAGKMRMKLDEFRPNAVIHHDYLKEIPLYDSKGKKLGFLKNDDKNEDYIYLEIVRDSLDFFYVKSKMEMELEVKEGWIKKNRQIGTYARNYSRPSLKLYSHPTKKSKPQSQILDRIPEMYTVQKVYQDWVYVQIEHDGVTYSGWLQPNMQCPNSYMTCN
ncbi:SH3 domain-containing protein [Aureicoccus marinus]|uniref:SH3b domain-containing protein n=1 Tax=Aureicoccus marinus TaxID=754435 RepID=A0A2S7T6W9_9FLAO|nr:SH3 domain-containing protein [Aureicoccus marinus]PQJ15331.1 hypothetical protein BST99_05900 [Aureicoccus marinus]